MEPPEAERPLQRWRISLGIDSMSAGIDAPEHNALRFARAPHEEEHPAGELERVRLHCLAAPPGPDIVTPLFVLGFGRLAHVREHAERVHDRQRRVSDPGRSELLLVSRREEGDDGIGRGRVYGGAG